MFLDPYFSVQDGLVRITAEQASRFAKEIAGDFNPIHDPDAKRFCVPGDLLFALVLSRYGLSSRMEFAFRGMVGDDVPLVFPDQPGETFDVADQAGKVYLQVLRGGETTGDPAVVEGMVRRYVAFSGRNFPHFLLPLLEEKQVMFNPDRPLVIYDSMGFELTRLDATAPAMELVGSSLDVAGKRGDARLRFRIDADGEAVGSGAKKLTISSLRAYDETRIQAFVADFERRRDYRR